MVLGVPILKHFRVIMKTILSGYLELYDYMRIILGKFYFP